MPYYCPPFSSLVIVLNIVPVCCSIVYDTEFSSRLSISSIMRLQAAAMLALSNDSDADSAVINKLARRFLSVSNYLWTKPQVQPPASELSPLPLRRESKKFNQTELLHGTYDYHFSLMHIICIPT